MHTLDRMLFFAFVRSYAIVLTSLLSLYVVIDLFTNLDDFAGKHRGAMARDIDADPVFLAKSAWEVGYVEERFPKVRFGRAKERG